MIQITDDDFKLILINWNISVLGHEGVGEVVLTKRFENGMPAVSAGDRVVFTMCDVCGSCVMCKSDLQECCSSRNKVTFQNKIRVNNVNETPFFITWELSNYQTGKLKNNWNYSEITIKTFLMWMYNNQNVILFANRDIYKSYDIFSWRILDKI